MKNVLITGAHGFLGWQLYDLVLGDPFDKEYIKREIIIPERGINTYNDLNNFDWVKRLISDNEIDTIFHLAAQSIVRIANTNPKYCFENNIVSTVNVIEAARQVNPKIKILIASSDKAYGETQAPYFETSPLSASDPYSTSKACSDLIAQSYAKTYGLNINIVRSANIYGGGDTNYSRLIPNTITRILRGEKPQIYSGVLKFMREFIHVDDVCRAYLTIAEKGIPGEAYNVGTGTVSNIGAMIDTITEIMEWENGIDVIQKSFPEIETQYLNCDKLQALGWSPQIDIVDGLKQTIDWYKENA